MDHQGEFVVRTHQLSKQYPQGKMNAVRDVSLEVRRGELFGLLGPNGAGKTTLVKMLCTLILPTSGSAELLGYTLDQPSAIRAHVGLAVTDERSFYWRLSVHHNLRFFAATQGLFGRTARHRVDEILEGVGLLDRANTPFGQLSSGMRQRMAIARSLLHRPKLLFLDEPTRSLDPTATAQLHDLILRLQAQHQMTIFLITHDLIEAEKLCQRVAILHQGRVQAVGSTATLREKLRPVRHYRLTISGAQDRTQLLAQLRPMGEEVRYDETDSTLHLLLSAEYDQLPPILALLNHEKIAIHHIESELPSLEALFHQLTAPSQQSPL